MNKHVFAKMMKLSLFDISFKTITSLRSKSNLYYEQDIGLRCGSFISNKTGFKKETSTNVYRLFHKLLKNINFKLLPEHLHYNDT